MVATDAARDALSALKVRNPELFGRVRDQLRALRGSPEHRDVGRAFRLTDGRTARLAVHYDAVLKAELGLVWIIASGGGEPVVQVLALELVG